MERGNARFPAKAEGRTGGEGLLHSRQQSGCNQRSAAVSANHPWGWRGESSEACCGERVLPARIFESHQVVPGVRLLLHRSRKWKSEILRFVFVERPDREVAARAVAAHLLRHGHTRCRGLDAVARHFRQQYGGGVGCHVAIGATRHLLNLRTNVVGGRHLPRKPDTLARGLRFVAALMRKPWLMDRDFDAELFERERANLLRAIDAIRDDKARYADLRLREEMFRGGPLAMPAHGHREDVASLTLDDVRAAMTRTFASAPLLIYAVADRPAEDLIPRIAEALGEHPRRSLRVPAADLSEPRPRPRRVVEREDVSQARLAMGYRIRDWDLKRDLHATLFGDLLLGGSSTSKLFKEVRERRSLAYSIWSSGDSTAGALTVAGGMDTAHLGQVQKLVGQQVRALAAGRVSDDEFEAARASIAKTLAGTWDSPDGLIQFDLAARLGRRREQSPEALLRRYLAVDRDAVAEVFGRMQLDTVFRLEAKGESS
jgi:predicted Zn-dependent peptidase